MECAICGNAAGNVSYEAQEMMYGMPETFGYVLCAECGCLQIGEIPENIEKYYAGPYYSYAHKERTQHPIKQKIVRLRNHHAITGKGRLGRWLHRAFPTQAFQALRPLNLQADSRIIDVGCGSGTLLSLLASSGMGKLLGADPFIPEELNLSNGVKVLKKPITEVDGLHDLVMFNHSFEHIPNQLETLQHVAGILKPDGYCMIRVPTVSSYAWRHYGVHWVQLDAPRHFYLHSTDSLARLAKDAGLRVDKVVYDSTAFQFWGSEQYVQGITLHGPRSYAVDPAASPFSDDDIDGFKRRAHELNRTNQGDQAIFYLRPMVS